MDFKIDKLKKRLLYRSQYRGTKEMDKLIGSFVKAHISILNIEELIELEKFLELDDDNLYKFYNNQKSEITNKDNKMLNLFKNFIYE